jgi:hypothetical protein
MRAVLLRILVVALLVALSTSVTTKGSFWWFGGITKSLQAQTKAVQSHIDALSRNANKIRNDAGNAHIEAANIKNRAAALDAERAKLEGSPTLDAQVLAQTAAERSRRTEVVAARARDKNGAVILRDRAVAAEAAAQHQRSIQTAQLADFERQIQQAEAAQRSSRQRVDARKVCACVRVFVFKREMNHSGGGLEPLPSLCLYHR